VSRNSRRSDNESMSTVRIFWATESGQNPFRAQIWKVCLPPMSTMARMGTGNETRFVNVMLAKYMCLKCGHEWEQKPKAVTCQKCEHLYVKWLNYDEMTAKSNPSDVLTAIHGAVQIGKLVRR